MLQYQIDRIEHQVDEDRAQTGVFLIGPLERGQATTLGNALRRVLMGGLEGSAVTAIRIAGVNHEYATIPGVREDVLDILLNCKQLSINNRSGELEIGRLVIAGPADVKAGDLQFSSQVQVVDVNRPIATVADGHSLELEVHVERGVGYRPVDRHNEDTSAIDLLQIDAVFMPVIRVNFSIDETAVAEGGSARERLRIEIVTDGSIHPKDALTVAAKTLIHHFMLFSDERITLEADEIAQTETYDEESLHMRQLLKTKLIDMDLSVRALNCLKAAEVDTLGDLVSFNKNDLMKFRNFGKKSLTELEELVNIKGLNFGMDLSKYKLDKD